jgi:hypothetical protein
MIAFSLFRAKQSSKRSMTAGSVICICGCRFKRKAHFPAAGPRQNL